jgi:hypothetical protein
MGEFLLGNQWLETLVHRLDNEGLSEEQIATYADAWSITVVRYVLYLASEGYSTKQIVQIVNEAVEQADYDLRLMPIIPSIA